MTPPANLTRRQSRRRLAGLLALCLALAITMAIHLIARAQPAQGNDNRSPRPPKQQFLLVLEGARPTIMDDITPSEQKIVDHHFALLQQAHRQGKVALVGRCDDTPLGLIILQVASREEAQEILDNDPAVQAGLMRGKLHPFTVYMGSLQPH
jgi:uncharacterized protein YciI